MRVSQRHMRSKFVSFERNALSANYVKPPLVDCFSRGSLVIRSWLRVCRGLDSKPDSTEDPGVEFVDKKPPAVVVWKFGDRVPVQVSSSSSDRISKLRG
ncbi:hypothetical protein AVEN_34569-1 [Araneus ventricosus]|uniref:Uncharacterized protein n=1 Tax=Araneus ventricosus TaxID=182803 RepID=A0A4Y2B1P3_ARAVE|nr:hypothetical protein AVEN_34569-1 [Araneus ventricosus]